MIDEIGKIFGKKEDKKELEAEKRNRDFVKQSQSFEAAMEDDVEYVRHSEERSNLIHWQQDLEDDLSILIHQLRREVEVNGVWQKRQIFLGTNEKGEHLYGEMPPMINEIGISSIYSFLRGLTSKNLINSNYSEELIYKSLKRSITQLVLHLRDNFLVYEIRKEDLALLISLIKNNVEPSFWRAYNNGEVFCFETDLIFFFCLVACFC